jgi:phage-related protein
MIILLSAFQKKTQKTPKKEIRRAEKLKKEYYENK